MSAGCQHVGYQHAPCRPAWQRVLLAPLWLVTALLLALIWIYRLILSPILGALGAQCRFHPTCSVYAAEALRKYGLFVGSAKAAYRLLRCHPFCRGGHDPP